MPRWLMVCFVVVLGYLAVSVVVVLVGSGPSDGISRESCDRQYQLLHSQPLESDVDVIRACNRAGFRARPRVNYSRERCEREFELSFRSPLEADDSVLADCDRAGLLPYDRLDEFLSP